MSSSTFVPSPRTETVYLSHSKLESTSAWHLTRRQVRSLGNQSTWSHPKKLPAGPNCVVPVTWVGYLSQVQLGWYLKNRIPFWTRLHWQLSGHLKFSKWAVFDCKNCDFYFFHLEKKSNSHKIGIFFHCQRDLMPLFHVHVHNRLIVRKKTTPISTQKSIPERQPDNKDCIISARPHPFSSW